MTQALTLDDVVDDTTFVSFEHQLHLADTTERLGEFNWQADLDARKLDFVGQETLATTVHMLGSTAENPGTWLWGWANPSGYSEEVTALGRQAAEFGRQYQIAELAEPEQPLTPQIGARLTDTVKIVTDHWTSCSFEVSPGSTAYFLIDAPVLALPAPSVPGAPVSSARAWRREWCTTIGGPWPRTPGSAAFLRRARMTPGPGCNFPTVRSRFPTMTWAGLPTCTSRPEADTAQIGTEYRCVLVRVATPSGMLLGRCHVCRIRRIRGGRVVTLLDSIDNALGTASSLPRLRDRVVDHERTAS